VRQQLPNFKAEYFVSSCFKFFLKLRDTCLVFVVLKKCLDSSFDEGLLKTVTMVFLFAILKMLAFLIPIEFEVDVPSGCSNWKV